MVIPKGKRIVVLAGTNSIAVPIVYNLLERAKGSDIVVLEKSEKLVDEKRKPIIEDLIKRGVRVSELPKPNTDELRREFDGAEVIISAFEIKDTKEQIPYIEEAKRNKVKRFIPSDFELDPENLTLPESELIRDKRQVLQKLELEKIDYAMLSAGVCFERIFSPENGTCLKIGKTAVYGSEKTRFSFTLKEDIAKVVVDLALKPTLSKRSFKLSAETCSFEKVLHKLEEVTGKKIEKKLESEMELKKRCDAPS